MDVQLNTMRAAGRLTSKLFSQLLSYVKPGTNLLDIDKLVFEVNDDLTAGGTILPADASINIIANGFELK